VYSLRKNEMIVLMKIEVHSSEVNWHLGTDP
jgi:hypothetical protein